MSECHVSVRGVKTWKDMMCFKSYFDSSVRLACWLTLGLSMTLQDLVTIAQFGINCFMITFTLGTTWPCVNFNVNGADGNDASMGTTLHTHFRIYSEVPQKPRWDSVYPSEPPVPRRWEQKRRYECFSFHPPEPNHHQHGKSREVKRGLQSLMLLLGSKCPFRISRICLNTVASRWVAC